MPHRACWRLVEPRDRDEVTRLLPFTATRTAPPSRSCQVNLRRDVVDAGQRYQGTGTERPNGPRGTSPAGTYSHPDRIPAFEVHSPRRRATNSRLSENITYTLPSNAETKYRCVSFALEESGIALKI